MSLSFVYTGLIGLTSGSGKTVKKLIWGSTDKELKDVNITNACQPAFVGSSTRQAKLTSLFKDIQ